jgi:hypothetical protein
MEGVVMAVSLQKVHAWVRGDEEGDDADDGDFVSALHELVMQWRWNRSCGFDILASQNLDDLAYIIKEMKEHL